MNGQQLQAALRSGQRVYGTCILSTSPRWLKVAKKLTLDFVFIDTEHTPIGRETLAWMCQAYSANNLAPIVRIPAPDPYLACMALDGGASGVIAPYVETVEQVQALRGAVKWRPLKGQMLADILAGRVEPDPTVADYLAAWNTGNLLVVNIESRPAMAALDDILAVPQLDVVLVGPHDLSINLGIPEQYTHPRFEEAIRTIIAKARSRGVGVGIHFSDGLAQHIDWARAGANFILHSSDLTLFGQTLKADLAAFRAATGEDGQPAADGRQTMAEATV